MDDDRVVDAGESLPRERSECIGYDLDGPLATGADFNVDVEAAL